MAELAFNVHGEPFEVFAATIGWRVKRLEAKGAPEVVYGRDGLPLVLPVDSDLDDLRDVGLRTGLRFGKLIGFRWQLPRGTADGVDRAGGNRSHPRYLSRRARREVAGDHRHEKSTCVFAASERGRFESSCTSGYSIRSHDILRRVQSRRQSDTR